MSNLTRTNAKYHCRTCLSKLDLEETTNFVKVDANKKALLAKYLKNFPAKNEPNLNEVPYICISCYNEVRCFDAWLETSIKCARKLQTLWLKVKNELNDEDTEVMDLKNKALEEHTEFLEDAHEV